MFTIALSSEMKEEEGIAGVTGWRSIIDAKVTWVKNAARSHCRGCCNGGI